MIFATFWSMVPREFDHSSHYWGGSNSPSTVAL